MSSEGKQNHELRLAHVLFVDIVGYSKLPINRQSELLRQLNQIVRGTEQFRRAEAANKLVRLPTGDGMALVFFTSPDAPVRCALEISQAVGQALPPAGKEQRQAGALALQLRMGINSGPVDAVADVNDRSNVAGAGINMAQRVMDCCDAGHILLSKRVADDLGQYEEWQPYLHELGLVEVKHGVRVEIVNFYSDKVGNPELPEKVKRAREVQSALDHRASKVAVRKWALLFGLVLLLVIGVPGSWLLFRRVAQRSTNATSLSIPDKSIAVLPLENLSEEKENAFFADGIQEELLSSLAKIKDLKVISRTSVMQYKTGITRNLKEIARQLGVSNVIEGSVRRSGNHIRVSVQLIDALTDRHIWVQDYDRTMADSLALQGELATEIAAGVGATLSPQEKARVEAKPTNNTAAYDAYLRGRAFASGDPFDKPTVEGAIHSYQEAVKLDPTFVLAWARLSSVQSGEYWTGLDPTPARLAAAKDSLDHARALDPNLPETHLALGYYRYYGQRDFTGALAEFQLAEKNLPNNVDVLQAMGLIQRRLGHWDEAIAALRRAVELDPRNINSAFPLAITYMSVRRYSDVARVADHILAIEPANAIGIERKVRSLWAFGESAKADSLLNNPGVDVGLIAEDAMHKRRFNEAVVLLAKAAPGESANDKTGRLLSLGLAQQRAGNGAAARTAYQQAAQEFQRELGKVAPDSGPAAELHSGLGVAYAGLGDASSAVAEGQKGMVMQPSSEDPFEGPNREEAMAKIYALLGDADHALPILQRLLQTSAPTEIVPTLLRLDPIWDQIRNDPRFQELAEERKP
jgi:TolB-like protein/tetratricopeptide (TPR) repeat protein/class 3 adenylate cyclase